MFGRVPLNRRYQRPICAALITVKAGEFPELRIKAYAGRVLLSFLQHKCAQLVNSQRAAGTDIDQVLLMIHYALVSLCDWFLKVETAQRYLSATEAEDIWAESMRLLGFLIAKHVLLVF